VPLSPGYSFDDHCRKIWRNMNAYLRDILDHVYPKTVVYTCAGVADEVFEDIRADPGLTGVSCATNKLPKPEQFKQQR